jgi:hypothetical protein
LEVISREELSKQFQKGPLECWSVEGHDSPTVSIKRLDDVSTLSAAVDQCKLAGSGEYHLCDKDGPRFVVVVEGNSSYVFTAASNAAA